jgi:hypothetical protein
LKLSDRAFVLPVLYALTVLSDINLDEALSINSTSFAHEIHEKHENVFLTGFPTASLRREDISGFRGLNSSA